VITSLIVMKTIKALIKTMQQRRIVIKISK
jgi:hypothetical protein